MRLENGIYGQSENCGLAIEPRRLEIMAETPRCRGRQSQRGKLAKAAAR